MALGKLFIFRHGMRSNEGIIEADREIATQVLAHVANGGADEGHVSAYVEYHKEFYAEESKDIIRFLQHSNIDECGTIEAMELDYFWVSNEPLWCNDEGNWLYKGYMLGCDEDTVQHLVRDQNWSATQVINMVMQNLQQAISEDN